MNDVLADGLSPDVRATAWDAARRRVGDLVAGVDLSVTVPATPDWTAKQLLGHMVGVSAAHAAGTAESGHPQEWTARTVADRDGRSTEQVLAEWASVAPAVRDLIGGDEPGLLIDTATHEQDLRGALRRPGARDDVAAAATFAFYVGSFLDAASDLPALVVVAGDRTFRVGSGAEVGRLTVEEYELQRACAGRRSAAQVRAWDWPVDPAAYLTVLSRYGSLHEVDLVE